ncbi:MAG: hypothetical protein RLZZ502_1873 [Pseudomonadota bacterium]|jgi:cytochrome c-type biogenesis protein CcmH
MMRYIVLLLLSFSLHANVDARYKQLTESLRCVVCQNQNLADSNAELAMDLKKLIREQLQAGKTDAEIEAFMVARYGEFVKYQPSFSGLNMVLWLLPVLCLGLLIFLWSRKNKSTDTPKITAEQLSQAEHLLK